MKTTNYLPLALLIACGNPAPTELKEADPPLRIAFNVFTDTPEDNYEVFVMDLDGSNRRNITNTPGVDWVYSAYKDKLYFLSDRDTCHRCYFLYEMDADGNNVRRISDQRLQDSWMSSRFDGAEFIVDPKGINDTAFFRISRDGAILDTLYHGLPYANDPCFSPDGKRIVFRGAQSKFKQDDSYHDELYVMDSEGGNLQQLTSYPTSDTTAHWFNYHAGPPFWEPHSDRISYCSLRKGNYSIFSIKPDGTDERQITGDSLAEGWHAWSPDGQWLVYNVSDAAENWFDIELMSADGKVVKRLTSDTLTEQAPVFVALPK